MSELGIEFEEIQKELAYRLRVLGKMFTELGNERGAAGLLKSLLADDPSDFHQLLERYDLPQFPLQGKCVWIRQVVDDVLLSPNVTERCVLRADLTAQEKAAVLRIAARHLVLFVDGELGGQVIAPGPLLEDLKLGGFVTCTEGLRTSRPFSLLGPYEQHCV